MHPVEPSPSDAPLTYPYSRSRKEAALRWFWLILAGVILGIATPCFVVAIVDKKMGVLSNGLPVAILLMVALVGKLMRGRPELSSTNTLFYVSEAVRLNLPLPPFLEAAAASERTGPARRIRVLCDRLLRGESLATALRSSEPTTPARTLAKIDAAERSGQLARTLRGLAARAYRDQRSYDAVGDIYRQWYPLILIVALFSGTTILEIFVIPKFQQIFKDFGVQLPPVTRALISVYRDWGPTISAACAAILILLIAKLASDAIMPRGRGPGLLMRALHRLIWWTPLVAGAVRSRALADALEVIADTVTSGGSLSKAVDHAARLPSNPVLQHRLTTWSKGLVAGMPIQRAAAEARMPGAVCRALALATSTSSMESTLRFLARHYETRVNRADALARAAVIPMISLFFGAIVLFVVLALFTPLIELMNHLAGAMS